MGSKRSRLQISVEVLAAIANGEQKPTRLMYACNLSWTSTKETLDRLAARGLVDEINENQKRRRYCITVKGRDVVKYYARLQDLIPISI